MAQAIESNICIITGLAQIAYFFSLLFKPVNVHSADVAQLVEQLIRNEKVGGSTPLIGTMEFGQKPH